MPSRRTGDPGGKLKAAARRWAGGRGGPAVPADDALTASARLPRRRVASADEELELSVGDEANSAALFFALDTQWRRHPLTGSRLGIDYAAIKPTAEAHELPFTPQVMKDVQVMEREALNVMATQS